MPFPSHLGLERSGRRSGCPPRPSRRAWLLLVAVAIGLAGPGGPAFGQPAVAEPRHQPLQTKPGEGDGGESEPAEWYDSLVASLRPGDLLSIANTSRSRVTHVVMWVGECGSSPDGTPLVIDSTGGRIKDANGHAIPCGIHLRPFRKGSWYHASFDHAHRWLH